MLFHDRRRSFSWALPFLFWNSSGLCKDCVITNIPIPTKQIDVRSLLGHVGHYRRFIKDFNKLVAPLYNLLKKEAEFEWTEDCEAAFHQLKDVLTTPILRGPYWKLPFHIHTNASDIALGAFLGQKEGTVEHVIYYISKNL